jgi:predicted phosphodiesterase
MRVVCISDTHNHHEAIDLPDGDLLIHAGDFSGRGRDHEVHAFFDWFARQPHRHKVVIAGNHDFLFENHRDAVAPLLDAFPGVTYLEDSGTTLGGLRIWGSPWQPWFHSWAFNLREADELRAKWDLIPAGIDLLVTHGPPHRHGDLLQHEDGHVGCRELLKALDRVRPVVHIFGHIHEAYGIYNEAASGTICINAATCTLAYEPENPPVVFDIDDKRRVAFVSSSG